MRIPEKCMKKAGHLQSQQMSSVMLFAEMFKKS